MTLGTVLYRLEYLTRNGWEVGHAGVNLLHPDRYAERLAERGKVGRVLELGDDLQPTGRVWGPNDADLPDPAELVASDTKIPRRADPLCEDCGHRHPLPHDGMCLL